MKWSDVLMIVLLILIAVGCTTTSNKFEEVVQEFDAEGNITSEIKTSGESKAKVGAMVKAKEMSQDWKYTYGGEENQITFGSSGIDYDATAQADVAIAVSNAIQPLMDALAKSVVEAVISYFTTAPILPPEAVNPFALRAP